MKSKQSEFSILKSLKPAIPGTYNICGARATYGA